MPNFYFYHLKIDPFNFQLEFVYMYILLGLSIHHLKQGEADIPNSRAIHTLMMKLQEIMRGEKFYAYHIHILSIIIGAMRQPIQVL